MSTIKTFLETCILIPLLVIASGLGALVVLAAYAVLGVTSLIIAATGAVLTRHGGTIAIAAAIAFAAWSFTA